MLHSKTINEIFSQGNDLDFLNLELESALLDCKKGTLLQFNSQVKEALGNLTILENAIKGIAALDLAASLRLFDDFYSEYLDLLDFTLKLFDLDVDMNIKRELLSSICNLILVTKTSLKAAILRKIFYLIVQLLGFETLELEPIEVLIFQRYLLRIPKIMASESSQLINLAIKKGLVLAPILIAVDSIITETDLSISTQCCNSMIYIHCLYTQSFAYKPEELTPRLPMMQANTVYDSFCLVKDFEIYSAILCLIIQSSLANSVNFVKIISVLKLYLKSILANDSIGITVLVCIHNLLFAIFTRLPSDLIRHSQDISKIVLNILKYCLSHRTRNFGDHRLLAVKVAIQFRCTILSVQSSKSQFDNILLEDFEDSANRYLTELTSPSSVAPTREGLYVLGLLKVIARIVDHASIGECDRFAETIIHFLLDLDVSCQIFTSKSNAFLALDIVQSGLGLLNIIFLVAAPSTKKSISPLMALLYSRTCMLSAEIGELSDRAILFFELSDPKGNIFYDCPSKPGGITPVKRSYPSSTPKSLDFIRTVNNCPKAETEPVNLTAAAESVIAPSISEECFHIGSRSRGNAKSDAKIPVPVNQSRNPHPEFPPHQKITVQVPEKEAAISTNLVKLEDCESMTAASISTPCDDREQLPEIFYHFDESE